MGTKRFISPNRPVVAGLAAVLLAVGVASCGDDGDSGLSELGKRGKEISTSNGCASCHGANGQGGVGPPWTDLAGRNVELKDGTTVVADDEYLLRAILEPDAEEVAGYTLKMPSNGVSEADAALIVTYIKELSASSTDG